MSEQYVQMESPVHTGGYPRTLIAIITGPGRFFRGLPRDIGLKQPVLFLIISSIIAALAGLSQQADNRLLLASARFFNSMGLTFIAAAAGLIPAKLFRREDASFPLFFSVYAYSFGAVALIGWLPSFIWCAESIKWVLVGLGLIHACGFKRYQALLIIITSIGLTFLAVYFTAALLL